MTEPLTLRGRRILQVLNEERENGANDLTSADVNLRAFNARTRVGPVKHELGTLAWRGLVEQSELDRDSWRITDSGVAAL